LSLPDSRPAAGRARRDDGLRRKTLPRTRGIRTLKLRSWTAVVAEFPIISKSVRYVRKNQIGIVKARCSHAILLRQARSDHAIWHHRVCQGVSVWRLPARRASSRSRKKVGTRCHRWPSFLAAGWSAHVLGFGYDRWRRFGIGRWIRLSVTIRQRSRLRQGARCAEVDRWKWCEANVRLADFLERLDRSRGSAESRTV